MFPDQLETAANQLLDSLRAKGATLVTAESCTGGLIAGLMTSIAGSSDVVWGGFVTYANGAKTGLLGVPDTIITQHGAVSAQTVKEMALGAITRSTASHSIAVTGVAGPGGGTDQKPVGLVYIAVARRDGDVHVERHYFHGDRESVRLQTVEAGLSMLSEFA